MRRCVAFVVAVLVMCGLTARADYLYVKIDLSQVYQNIPTMAAGAFAMPGAVAGPGPQYGRGGVGPGIGRAPIRPPQPFPMPIPMPGGVPMPPPGPGEGPFVYAAIEIRPKPIGSKEKPYIFDGKKDETGAKTGAHLFDHTWGKDGRFVDTPTLTPGIIKYIIINKDSPLREYERTFRKELLATKDPRKLIHAATWALQHGWSRRENEPGLINQFHGVMEDLRKLDPKHPAVANYLRVQAALRKPPAADDPAAKSLMAELSGKYQYHTITGNSAFYVALTNQQPNFDGDTKRRLNRLHESMESFYYWFALNDQLPQPALPRYRQLLIVPNSVEEFYAKHALWGSPAFSGDGLTPRRDNIILMSSRPVDDIYRVFSGNNQELCKKLQLPQDWFVKGTIWEQGSIIDGRDIFNVAFTQTLTLVQKAIEEEAELATLTREGARQLLFASDILPRHVHTPDWIAEGMASYFETSPGALYRGIGLPSWSNLVSLKYFRIAKKLEKPADILANVITDRYFRNAQKTLGDLIEMGDNDNKLSEQLREELELANSTSWAFAYFMIERRRDPQRLLRYCQELSALPRDMELDDRALEACFAKVFDMPDPSNPARVDRAKFGALADAWFAEMSGVSLEVPEMQNEYLENRKLAAKKKAAAN